ncbi:DNA repair protein complementing XP-C cells homolog [Phlebotomus argentipes]|uniref:DNA repair protein complementing XP-C cells homolog n=1 Tax=Phlebotomus argentipes TaxID=94469 RepID=UPI002892F119|nr:DNA repair protein complementing XP-C cells homolog [Phlebotomus argentipes]
MSDADEFPDSEEESPDDFSASEDEWKPSKKDASSSEEEDLEVSDDEEAGTSSRGGKRKRAAVTRGKGNVSPAKRKTANLRSKLFKKYQPPPKTVKSPPGPPRIIPGSIQQILNQSRYQKGKKVAQSEDSSSSGDEHLVPASELDLGSSFFSGKDRKEATPPPEFDCNIGTRLSDSEEEDEQPDIEEKDAKIMSKIVSRINQSSSKSVHFRKLADFTEAKPETSSAAKHDNLDISSLLAMGESTGAAAKSVAKSPSKSQKAAKGRKRAAARDSESDWEEVEGKLIKSTKKRALKDAQKSLYWENPQEEQIPADGIVVELPSEFRRRTKKEVDMEACIKRKLNRQIKENQVYLHKSNLVCFLATGNQLNAILCKGKLLDAAVKLLPSKNSYPTKNGADSQYFQNMTSWFRGVIKLDEPKMYGELSPDKLQDQLDEEIRERKASCFRNFILIFLLLLRGMAIDSRLIMNYTGNPLRPPTSKLCRISAKPKVEKPSKDVKRVKIEQKPLPVNGKSPEKMDEKRKTRSQVKNEASQKPNLAKLKPQVKKIESPQPSTSRSSRLFAPEAVIPRKPNLKAIDRRVLSSDSDDWTKEKRQKENKMDIWVEVFSDKEKKWLPIDLFNGKVDKVEKLIQTATQPIAYVFAWHADKTVKDVSPRYCPQWNTVTRKFRIDREWLEETLQPFVGRKTRRDKEEDRELDKIHLDKPLPKTITEYKDHPLYVLERHLLKYQAIYPPNPPPLGYVRNEPVYARECVHTLHTRETWLKQARVVKPEQTAYKVVKTLKWDKYSSTLLKDVPLDIFGVWQTDPFVPPVAKDGIVPRNEYGNVELFKACMLPKNTVHLQLPGINKICKRLSIDCAPAIVGFDFHNGWCHPTLDGFVICKEFEDTVLDAWNQEQDEAERKEDEKRDKRVYGNWRKLIKGLLIRVRLQAKYNFKGEEEEMA